MTPDQRKQQISSQSELCPEIGTHNLHAFREPCPVSRSLNETSQPNITNSFLTPELIMQYYSMIFMHLRNGQHNQSGITGQLMTYNLPSREDLVPATPLHHSSSSEQMTNSNNKNVNRNLEKVTNFSVDALLKAV